MAQQKHHLFTTQAGVELLAVGATWKGQSAPTDTQTVPDFQTLVSILEMDSITIIISITGKFVCISCADFEIKREYIIIIVRSSL